MEPLSVWETAPYPPMTADLPYLLNALFFASLNPSRLLPHLHFPLLTHKENITEYCPRGRGLQEGKRL